MSMDEARLHGKLTQDEFYEIKMGDKFFHDQELEEYEVIRWRNEHWLYVVKMNGDCSKICHANSVRFNRLFSRNYTSAVAAKRDAMISSLQNFEQVYGKYLK